MFTGQFVMSRMFEAPPPVLVPLSVRHEHRGLGADTRLEMTRTTVGARLDDRGQPLDLGALYTACAAQVAWMTVSSRRA
jgi:hypothetical protein